MRRIIVCFLLLQNGFIYCQFKNKFLMPVRQLNAGIDLSQFNYYLDSRANGFNGAACVQYKPYHFLELNSTFGHNDVRTQRANAYARLSEYHSRGAYLKLGFGLSVRVARRYDNRFFIGYHSILGRFRESGRFEIQNYWGPHVNAYELGPTLFHAREIIFGFQVAFKRCMIRPQFYSISLKDDMRISHNDEILNNYRSPFIPGFGFRRGGLNLMLVYMI